MAFLPGETKYLPKGGSKTFGASFEKEGAVKAGETLASPVLTIASGHGLLITGLSVNADVFVDSENGAPIPAGKGVIARLDATNGVVGKYRIRWQANSSGGDRLFVEGWIEITEEPPA